MVSPEHQLRARANTHTRTHTHASRITHIFGSHCVQRDGIDRDEAVTPGDGTGARPQL